MRSQLTTHVNIFGGGVKPIQPTKRMYYVQHAYDWPEQTHRLIHSFTSSFWFHFHNFCNYAYERNELYLCSLLFTLLLFTISLHEYWVFTNEFSFTCAVNTTNSDWMGWLSDELTDWWQHISVCASAQIEHTTMCLSAQIHENEKYKCFVIIHNNMAFFCFFLFSVVVSHIIASNFVCTCVLDASHLYTKQKHKFVQFLKQKFIFHNRWTYSPEKQCWTQYNWQFTDHTDIHTVIEQMSRSRSLVISHPAKNNNNCNWQMGCLIR